MDDFCPNRAYVCNHVYYIGIHWSSANQYPLSISLIDTWLALDWHPHWHLIGTGSTSQSTVSQESTSVWVGWHSANLIDWLSIEWWSLSIYILIQCRPSINQALIEGIKWHLTTMPLVHYMYCRVETPWSNDNYWVNSHSWPYACDLQLTIKYLMHVCAYLGVWNIWLLAKIWKNLMFLETELKHAAYMATYMLK